MSSKFEVTPARCFCGSRRLRAIEFGNCCSVIKIAAEAFSNSGLREFTVPKTVLLIESFAFQHCHVSDFHVEAGNRWFVGQGSRLVEIAV